METDQQPQVPEKKLPSWLTTVTPFSKILALILFIALPFTAFYLGMQYQQKITVSAPVALVSQKNVVLTPTPATTDTSNWKTYGSKSYSIRYPSTWIAQNQTENNAQVIDIFNPSTMVEGYGNGGYTGTQVPTEEVSLIDISSNQTAKTYVDSIAQTLSSGPQSLYQDFLKGRKTIVINGITGEVYPDVGEGSSGDNIILNNSLGVMIKIHIIGDYNLGVLKQILSTFKFIAP